MGPITLFDKSFLQSISVDESVWFDQYFLANVCPVFYVETLADLDKSVREGRTPDQEVRIIASKFPQMHGSPNTHHAELCLGNLMGHPVPMDGRIPLAGGRPVKAGERAGVVFEISPEAEAFSRWQREEFLDVERLFARKWRESLAALDLNEMASKFRAIGIDGKNCKSLKHAYEIAFSVAAGSDKPFDRMGLAIMFLGIPRQWHRQILERWSIAGYPPLVKYSPYVAHVLTVEIFFQLALAANLISTDRPSNRLDIAYLHYLPFSMIFVSSDRLHKRCASLFLRPDQEFVWGEDLKIDLRKINAHFSLFPEEVKAKGVIGFADRPPAEGDFLVARIWDNHFPGWRRTSDKFEASAPLGDEGDLVEELRNFVKAPTSNPSEVDFDLHNPDSLSVQRFVMKRKGSWWQLPMDLKVSEDGEMD